MAKPHAQPTTRRRVPTQERSRQRVERMLDAAAVMFADEGFEGAAARDPALAKGLTTLRGSLLSEPVAEAHGMEHADPRGILN